MTPPDDLANLWDHLSDHSKNVLAEVVELLAVKRHTGDINLQCVEGGIREWYVGQRRRPKS